MKKIMMALLMSGFAYCSAEAQETKQVCKMSSKKEVSCYKTKYADNFPVCKGEAGYHICGETPTALNSTHGSVATKSSNVSYHYEQEQREMEQDQQSSLTAPQSQSYQNYGVNSSSSYEGYYNSRKGKMRVCYGGDNVAELNRAPYQGCESPAYDGPQKNMNRNLNVSNSEPMPSIDGSK